METCVCSVAPITALLCLLRIDVSTRSERKELQMATLGTPDTRVDCLPAGQPRNGTSGSSHKSTIIWRSGEWCPVLKLLPFSGISVILSIGIIARLWATDGHLMEQGKGCERLATHERKLCHIPASFAVCRVNKEALKQNGPPSSTQEWRHCPRSLGLLNATGFICAWIKTEWLLTSSPLMASHASEKKQ